jgi:RND family efflux transporter MFP subunit
MAAPKERLDELRIDRDSAARARPRTALLLAAVALVLGAAALGWWLSRPTIASVRTAPVARSEAGSGESAGVLDASGYVTARLQATISSKVTGKIVEVPIEEGLTVKQGDVLARLDTSTVQRQLEVAEAQLASARSALEEMAVRLSEAELNLHRTQGLVAAHAASDSELDASRAAVDALRARLRVGRRDVAVAERLVALRHQELEDRVIRAPFDGVVVTKNAQPGEMISPVSAGGGFTRTGVCTLVDMSSLEIEVDVNEAYINRVKPGQPVRATLDAYPEWRVPATVITPVPTANRQKATVRVRIGFDRLDPRILPDMGVKVTFLDDAPAVAAADAERGADGAPLGRHVRIPAAAVRDEGGRPVVFVFSSGSVERRAVRLGSRRERDVEVIAGLGVGEQVVVEGPEDLADGDRARARQWEGTR